MDEIPYEGLFGAGNRDEVEGAVPGDPEEVLEGGVNEPDDGEGGVTPTEGSKELN